MSSHDVTDAPADTDDLGAPYRPVRFRIRSALAGGRPVGTRFFDSAEHWSVVDGMSLPMADGSFADAATYEFKLSNGAKLKFGQILALAGDFYAIPTKPISDQSDTERAFKDAFDTLDHGNTGEIGRILAIMQEEFQALTEAILSGDPAHVAYEKFGDKWNAQYNQATGGSGKSNYYQSIGDWGRFMWLVSYNWDHFGEHARIVYSAGLSLAMKTAAEGHGQSGPAANTALLRAYMYLAFACHYLTDSYSAGHLRTPRRHMHDFNAAHTSTVHFAPDACSNLMHNEDSYNGLWVRNEAGDHWIAFGDGRYFDEANRANRNVMRAALREAIRDVYEAFKRGALPASARSHRLLPDLPLSANDKNNYSPLFTVVKPGEMAYRREFPTDPKAYRWLKVGDSYRRWVGTLLDFHSIFKIAMRGAPPKTGESSGPNVHDRDDVAAWLAQGGLLQSQGVPLLTDATPSLLEHGGRLWVCVKQGSQLLVGTHTGQWSEFEPIGVADASTGGCLVAHQGVLNCFYADTGGAIQWLQHRDGAWSSQGPVTAQGQVALTDAMPAAVSLALSNQLWLVWKARGDSLLHRAWRQGPDSHWSSFDNMYGVGQPPYAARTDDQPIAVYTPGQAYFYYRSHNGYSLYWLTLVDYTDGALSTFGNQPVATADGWQPTTTGAVAAASAGAANRSLMVFPAHSDGRLSSVAQYQGKQSNVPQFLVDSVVTSDGHPLRSRITPALTRFAGKYWLLTVDPDSRQVMLAFGLQ